MPRPPRAVDAVWVTDQMVKDNLQALRSFKKQIEEQQKRIEYLESEVLSKHTAAKLIEGDLKEEFIKVHTLRRKIALLLQHHRHAGRVRAEQAPVGLFGRLRRFLRF